MDFIGIRVYNVGLRERHRERRSRKNCHFFQSVQKRMLSNYSFRRDARRLLTKPNSISKFQVPIFNRSAVMASDKRRETDGKCVIIRAFFVYTKP